MCPHPRRSAPRTAPTLTVLVALLAGLARAETIDLAPARDGTVSSGRPGTSFEAAELLATGRGASASEILRSFLRFDLTEGVPGDAVIESAVLYLHQNGEAFNSRGAMELRRVTGNWPAALVWKGQPAAEEKPYAVFPSPPAGGWAHVEVTGLVRGWHSGKIPNQGVVLGSDEDVYSQRVFASTEAPKAAPYLRITLSRAQTFRRGDGNGDGRIDLSDAVYGLGYLFSKGSEPPCLKSLDIDDSGDLTITDPIALLGHIFLGGAKPRLPFDQCGVDPTEDFLDCGTSGICGGILWGCEDLAARAIDFRIVRRDNQWDGRVRITGTVTNLGGDFTSHAGEQAIYLLEEVPGVRPVVVARLDFDHLAHGESLTLSYERNWESSSPAEGEFPPTYQLEVSYDPDIALDDLDTNDDCHYDNNFLERSGSDINDLFRE